MDWRDRLKNAKGFQWDQGNAKKNIDKHQLSCEESEQVFFNRPLYVVEDSKHSNAETRFKAFGKNNTGKLITLSFTLRGELIRIISARSMNKKERAEVEKQN